MAPPRKGFNEGAGSFEETPPASPAAAGPKKRVPKRLRWVKPSLEEVRATSPDPPCPPPPRVHLEPLQRLARGRRGSRARAD